MRAYGPIHIRCAGCGKVEVFPRRMLRTRRERVLFIERCERCLHRPHVVLWGKLQLMQVRPTNGEGIGRLPKPECWGGE